MASDHILKSFDEELNGLTAAIAEMGARSQAQLDAAIAALLSRDPIAAAEVVRGDLAVDELERDVDARALRVLALRHPLARDLREVLSALRIGIYFERVCDYAKNIAKRSPNLDPGTPVVLLEAIARLSRMANQLLGSVLDAFVQRDTQKALEVRAGDARVDEAFKEVYRRILEYMQGGAQRAESGAHLLFIAKNIERIGDHATNIAEAVHFMVTGATLDDART